MNWKMPLPKEVRHQGFLIPVYLDQAAIEALKHSELLCSQANFFAHLTYHNPKIARENQTEKLDQLHAALRKAQRHYNELSTSTQAICSDGDTDETLFSFGDDIARLIGQVDEAIKAPRPQKARYESLYLCCHLAKLPKGATRGLNNKVNPSDFQLLMAVSARAAEGATDEVANWIDRTTKGYERLDLPKRRKHDKRA